LPSEAAQLSIPLLRPKYTPNKITNDSMKDYSQFKSIAAAVLALAVLPLATLRAQVTYELAPSAFTLAMVIKETAPGTFERNPIGGAFITENRQRIPAFFNEWATGRVVDGDIPQPTAFNFESQARIVSTRYGNRELINDLIEAGTIKDTDARGWSLVYVYGDPTADDFVEQTLVARKRGQEDVSLDIVQYDFSGGAYAGSFLATNTFRYDREGGVTSEVATVRGRYNYEDAVSLQFAVGETEANLGGLEIGSATYFSYYPPDLPDRSEIEYFSVPGAIRYTNLVGATTGDGFEDEDGEFFEFGSLVTGTASIGASRVITTRR